MANTYQIKPGDTLGRIAAAHQLSLADLLAANRQITNPNSIQVGQIINLPVPAATPASGTASSGTGAVNLDALKGHIKPEVLAQIPAIIDRFKINTPLVMAHFLAQCAHESCDFTAVSENLNYSAAALKSTFGKYFATDALLAAYARKPEAIGARVYALRNGNGNEASKDGWNFRGRGFIQLTGKSNYAAFAKFVTDNILAVPDLVAQKYPLLSAAWFFHDRKLIEMSALGATDDVVTKVTRVVNGGTNGLAERIKYFKTYYALLHQ
ncbi:LysM peptidoglycan-binding domain-containing protein [Hymenobacter monticola]|uniref:LysM peptidoglycan-binding domain-containing protein n=1 Tax=Hymenobacter monticola TaxID=1705399 RepID=A0ABY4BB95_9BACT|nr:LysM peptidoglycan-binding domain-containing protein [Hymenobacter monticola]UOE36044.1 LysM peptidoglycan-binding domain-containing protein [Hymenobacter monticola]